MREQLENTLPLEAYRNTVVSVGRSPTSLATKCMCGETGVSYLLEVKAYAPATGILDF
jgi:hypothetical protein